MSSARNAWRVTRNENRKYVTGANTRFMNTRTQWQLLQACCAWATRRNLWATCHNNRPTSTKVEQPTRSSCVSLSPSFSGGCQILVVEIGIRSLDCSLLSDICCYLRAAAYLPILASARTHMRAPHRTTQTSRVLDKMLEYFVNAGGDGLRQWF